MFTETKIKNRVVKALNLDKDSLEKVEGSNKKNFILEGCYDSSRGEERFLVYDCTDEFKLDAYQSVIEEEEKNK